MNAGAPNEAVARAALDAHGHKLMSQTGAFAVGVREEGGAWVLVLTLAGPPNATPPASVAGIAVRVEQGEAMSPL